MGQVRIPTERIAIHPEDIATVEERFGRQITLALAQGNYRRAKQLVDQVEQEAQYRLVRTDLDPLLDTPLAEIGIRCRTLNILEDGLNLLFVGGLKDLPTSRMLAVRSCGAALVDEVWQAVLQQAVIRDNRRIDAESRLANHEKR